MIALLLLCEYFRYDTHDTHYSMGIYTAIQLYRNMPHIYSTQTTYNIHNNQWDIISTQSRTTTTHEGAITTPFTTIETFPIFMNTRWRDILLPG